MSQLQKILDEKYPLKGLLPLTKKDAEEKRAVFTEGYNSAKAEAKTLLQSQINNAYPGREGCTWMRVENITNEHLAELWPVIGGTPHLFEHGKDELRTGLVDGNWSESTLQMDYFTMVCMLKKLRELGYDIDLLIDQGLAIEKQ